MTILFLNLSADSRRRYSLLLQATALCMVLSSRKVRRHFGDHVTRFIWYYGFPLGPIVRQMLLPSAWPTFFFSFRLHIANIRGCHSLFKRLCIRFWQDALLDETKSWARSCERRHGRGKNVKKKPQQKTRKTLWKLILPRIAASHPFNCKGFIYVQNVHMDFQAFWSSPMGLGT